MSTVFVGSYTAASAPGIHVLEFDQDRGVLAPQASFDGIENPSFLALHVGGHTLYAVSETGGDSGGAVHALRIERGGGVALVGLNHRSSSGQYPCHLRLDASGRWLVVSNYGSGDAAVFPIRDDGSLGERASFVRHAGSGPHPGRQEGPHVHSAIFTPDGRFLIAADLGIDRLVVYRFDADTGILDRYDDVAMKPGAGPRHMAFHPHGEHLFVTNELDSTVTVLTYDRDAARLFHLQTLATVPPGVAENSAADLHVSPSGSHVYVSNRGHNSLAAFGFDPQGGLGRPVVRPCEGDWPRAFGLSPEGGHVLVANRRSNDLVVLPLESGGAEIGPPVDRVRIPEPSCVTFA